MSIEPIDASQEGEEDYWEDDEDYDEDEDDEDIDAEAEAIAAKLWADINRGQQGATAPESGTAEPSVSVEPVDLPPLDNSETAPSNDFPSSNLIPKAEPEADTIPDAPPEHPALQTIRTILTLLSLDEQAKGIVGSWAINKNEDPSIAAPVTVLGELQSIASTGHLEKTKAAPLGNAILSLVKSDVLVSRPSLADRTNAPGSSTEKRKREDEEQNGMSVAEGASPLAKRPRSSSQSVGNEMVTRLTSAVHLLKTSLDVMSPSSLQPSEIASLHNPLHQVFNFAVSASKVVLNPLGYESNALQLQLQEISGLIQVLGVLSGMPFIEDPTSNTAVFPCTVPLCGKTFISQPTLNNHTHSTHGPPSASSAAPAGTEKTHQCTNCRQSFLRLHDLKRHLLTHAVLKHVFQCGGCGRVFSRRDAAKRHKDGAKEKLKGGELALDSEKARCAEGDIMDVEKDASGSMLSMADEDPEEGELGRTVLSGLYGVVLGLGNSLRGCVSSGSSSAPAVSPAPVAPPTFTSPPSLAAVVHPPGSVAPALQTNNTAGQPLPPSLEEAIKSVLAFAQQQQQEQQLAQGGSTNPSAG